MADAEWRNEARVHLRHANEFLDAADLEADDYPRPAGSSAILAGIRAKDAITVAVTGTSSKTQDHRTAVKELQAALTGRAEASDAARALNELLAWKTDVQYSDKRIEPSRITSLIRRARTLVELANEIVSQA